MLSRISDPFSYTDHNWFYLFAAIVIVSLALAVGLYSPLPLLIPVALISALFISLYTKTFFYLFFFLLPFSVEIELPGGFGTDIPSEPLMLVLMYLCVLFFLLKAKSNLSSIVKHPISLFVILHILWIAFSSIYSTNSFFSIKFLLAKCWYVLPFYFLPLLLLNSERDYKKLFSFLLSGLLISVSYVMIRHASLGFSFDSINEAVRPIYRNHVNYGVLLVACLPYMVYLISQNKSRYRILKYIGLTVILLAIYLTYTRAAHISVFLACAVFIIIKYRLAKPALLISIAGAIGLLTFLSINNNYLNYAPEYTKAIEHKKFDNLVEATYKMEDVSTVERLYRWVAGMNMIKERPLTGFGPATFYSEYKAYTVNSYKTYVSDNPEKSGIHNYYLMTAVEQGLPGLLIFIGLCFLTIIYGERAYHLTEGEKKKALLMAAVTSFILILAVLLINDLIEADKVGPIFFISAAIIAFFSEKTRKKNENRAKSIENAKVL